MVTLKSSRELKLMREAGRIVAQVLEAMKAKAAPGVTTAELNEEAERLIRKMGAIPSFKGYHGYPAAICTSINEQVVHGIPDGRRLNEGDILSVDVGAIYKGYHGDAAVTIPIGTVSPEARRLLEVTEGALWAGIAKARAGLRTGDISAAIQEWVESRGMSVVREYTGHGIGRQMHEDPQIPNFGRAGTGYVLREGMTFALEPMVNLGTWKTKVLGDGWTVVTEDGKLSAHFEHTVAVTDGEPQVLTVL
ncbi:MAG: type I methionyl aminopeptidase [Anaerolineae bacterium]|nr:type I methionyl aminopeptidase [Anaerolineae bacterium]